LALNGPALHIPSGFVFASATAGLKQSGQPDLAFAEAQLGANAAAVFTRNKVVAAPLLLDREHLNKTRGRTRAVIVNAGNANCATGSHGRNAALQVCKELGRSLSIAPDFVFPSSTGIIGVPLPFEKITAALPTLVSAARADQESVMAFARAIMTTDTRPKLASTQLKIGRNTFSVLGIAKGSGMIHPNLATMLVYLFTDIDASPAVLRRALADAVDASFNRISVDGDTSTNDTVLLLASGRSKCNASDSLSLKKFSTAVTDICKSLAEQIVTDGEGVRHVIELTVDGARTHADADRIARTIGHSQLVKTAWAGADPNWGRILAAAGRSGVSLTANNVGIWIDKHEVFRRGIALPFNHDEVHKAMLQPKYPIRVTVGRGPGKSYLLTTDLTTEYVHINADYST
jgi:glutamate N-acetyltransferase / amino-acid N-acetyltransferase